MMARRRNDSEGSILLLEAKNSIYKIYLIRWLWYCQYNKLSKLIVKYQTELYELSTLDNSNAYNLNFSVTQTQFPVLFHFHGNCIHFHLHNSNSCGTITRTAVTLVQITRTHRAILHLYKSNYSSISPL